MCIFFSGSFKTNKFFTLFKGALHSFCVQELLHFSPHVHAGRTVDHSALINYPMKCRLSKEACALNDQRVNQGSVHNDNFFQYEFVRIYDAFGEAPKCHK